MSKAKTIVKVPVVSKPQDAAEIRLSCLLEAAAKVFVAEGYEAASVSEIARRVKASKQTIYLLYPSKAELFQAAISWQADANYRRLSSLLVSSKPPREALTAFGTGLLELVLDSCAVGMLRLVYMECGRFPGLGQHLYDKGPGRAFALMDQYISQQRDLGRLRVADTAIAAEQFLDVITGKLLMRAALGVAPKPPETDKKRRIDAAVHVFMAAYGCEGE